MSGREDSVGNFRLLLHSAIVVANEYGQPVGQQLHEDEAPVAKAPRLDRQEQDEETAPRLRERILELEKREKNRKAEPVEAVLRKESPPTISLGHFKPEIPEWEYAVKFNPIAAEKVKR
ncbi:uncharacterized protein LOC135490868 [Lineus longissimus]